METKIELFTVNGLGRFEVLGKEPKEFTSYWYASVDGIWFDRAFNPDVPGEAITAWMELNSNVNDEEWREQSILKCYGMGRQQLVDAVLADRAVRVG